MALDRATSQLPIYASAFNSTGNWTAPANTSKIYVTLKGSSGGNYPSNGNTGGTAAVGGAYVTVAGGATYPVVIGAAGNSGSSNCTAYTVSARYGTFCSTYTVVAGSTGGTTTWDSNAIVVYGGNGAYVGVNGNAGSVSFETSLPPVYPSGASARVSDTTSSYGNAGAGQAYVFIV